MDYTEKVKLARLDLSHIPSTEIEVSQTYLNASADCLGLFYYNLLAKKGYLVRLKDRTWPATLLGTAFHRLMEDIVPMRLKGESLRSLQKYALSKLEHYYLEAENRVRTETPEIEITEPENGTKREDALRLGPLTAVTFLTRFIDSYLSKPELFPTEYKAEFEVEKQWEGFFVRGTIDLVFEYPDKTLLLDYKTSKDPAKFSKSDKGTEEDPQSSLYSYLYEELTGRKVESFTYLIADVVKNEVHFKTYPAVNERRVDNLRALLKGLLRFIYQVPERENFFIYNKWKCRFCKYKNLCPTYELRS